MKQYLLVDEDEGVLKAICYTSGEKVSEHQITGTDDPLLSKLELEGYSRAYDVSYCSAFYEAAKKIYDIASIMLEAAIEHPLMKGDSSSLLDNALR